MEDDVPVAAILEEEADENADVVSVQHFERGRPPVLKLYSVGDSQRLEHLVTGETVELAALSDGHSWALEEGDGGFGFLSTSSRPSVWCNELLRTTVWSCKDGVFFQTRTADEEVQTRWLSDIQAKTDIKYIWWNRTAGYDSVSRIAMLELHVPRDGVKYVFNLVDLQQALDFRTKYCRTYEWFKKMRNTWEQSLEGLMVPASHIYRPVDTRGIGQLRLHAHHGSTVAVLVVLVNGAINMTDKYDRSRCLCVLHGFLAECVPCKSLDFSAPALRGEPARTFRLRDFVLIECSHDHRLLHEVVGKRLDLAVVGLMSQRGAAHNTFVAQLMQGIGGLLQLGFDDNVWPSDPMHCRSAQGLRRPICRHWRQALGDLPMSVVRNQHRAGKLLKAMGFSGGHRSWVDSAFMRRYMLAMRLGHVGARSFAFSSDKARGSGRDWLSSSSRGFETKKIGYMQPVVHPETSKKQGRTS